MGELKKCPFCGGEATMKIHYGFDEKSYISFRVLRRMRSRNAKMCFRNNCYREMEQEGGRMIKVKAEANYGFAGTNMTFEEEFGDDVTDEEIEEAMRDMVMEQVNWSWEKE